MSVSTPKIDQRTIEKILKRIKAAAPFYVPEWNISENTGPGAALIEIYARLLEAVIFRLNQTPDKNFTAFLDMLGVKLLPAQAAKVPLTFKLSKGTEKEILIPARTRVAADKTDEHDELPFESEKNLLAIPSPLKAVISADPVNDAVYLPPPDFLSEELQDPPRLSYTIVASAAAGTKSLQLDHVTELKERDILKIGGNGQAEYVIIASLSGAIVHLTDKLSQAHGARTPIKKIAHFCLCEGKNKQEHGLYLGHEDLFNIESAANFVLNLELWGETPSDELRELVWQYWGEVKDKKGEDWHDFDTLDETQDLTQSGEVKLHKTLDGEIKEKEINGIKSRWIRCLVKEKLPPAGQRRLPILDKVKFKVNSSETKLPPDLAFNNDVPLDVTKPFSPFGTEPRIFDRFAIANKEAFSKKDAKVTLDVDVDARGVLSTPSAVSFDNKTKVFARGDDGRLIEIEIDADENINAVWIDHGYPASAQIATDSAPSAIEYRANNIDQISVFVRLENGCLAERKYNGFQWSWSDHNTPIIESDHQEDGIIFDPIAVCQKAHTGQNNRMLSVFVVGSSGRLFERCRDLLKSSYFWKNHGLIKDTPIAGSPYADCHPHETAGETQRVKVFAVGESGQLLELDSEMGSEASDEHSVYEPPDESIKPGSRPFAQNYFYHNDENVYAYVFVQGSDGELWKKDANPAKIGGEPDWESLGKPNGNHSVASNPHGPKSREHENIFVTDNEGFLWEWRSNDWKLHEAPKNTNLAFSPCFLRVGDDLYVFSADKNNALAELKIANFRLPGRYKRWREHREFNPVLSWEYWNAKGWKILKGLQDTTDHLLKNGKITFTLPEDVAETEIAGQKNFWIRARLVGGDYGRESFAYALGTTQDGDQFTSSKSGIRPPLVNELTISYELEKQQFPQICLTHNNLAFVDHTDACRLDGKHFHPFERLRDDEESLYLGFEKSFTGGPVKIFFNAEELPWTKDQKPKFNWTYSQKNNWGELSHLDNTEALIRRGSVELSVPEDFSLQSRFGDNLYWIRGALLEGSYAESACPTLKGVYPNTTWGWQTETVENEIIGSSNGEKNQTFSLLKSPVQEGEMLRIREFLPEDEKRALIAEHGKESVFEKKDENGKTLETWVLWQEKSDFFHSAATERHYVLDRASGVIQFGDGEKGMIPPRGENNIKAFAYQCGGGASGNVKAGEIKTVKSAVPGVDKVINPVAADGGADTATVAEMHKIGPARISHRDRAITAEDFEWLAKAASRKVVKARCLANTNNELQPARGWVTVIIVPDSREDKPSPSLELRRIVRQKLEAQCANTLSAAENLHICEPSYAEISVSAEVFVTSIDVVTQVEREINKKLRAFFHPLTGGPEGKGWDFGRDAAASDVYALLESVQGVDHAENLRLDRNGAANRDVIAVQRNSLVANGDHKIKLRVVEDERFARTRAGTNQERSFNLVT